MPAWQKRAQAISGAMVLWMASSNWTPTSTPRMPRLLRTTRDLLMKKQISMGLMSRE